jgi:hypothetical protein
LQAEVLRTIPYVLILPEVNVVLVVAGPASLAMEISTLQRPVRALGGELKITALAQW